MNRLSHILIYRWVEWVTYWSIDDWSESDIDLQMSGVSQILIYRWLNWVRSDIPPYMSGVNQIMIYRWVAWPRYGSKADWADPDTDLHLNGLSQMLIYKLSLIVANRHYLTPLTVSESFKRSSLTINVSLYINSVSSSFVDWSQITFYKYNLQLSIILWKVNNSIVYTVALYITCEWMSGWVSLVFNFGFDLMIWWWWWWWLMSYDHFYAHVG